MTGHGGGLVGILGENQMALGGWDSTLQLMDRYDLDADFSCRVVGVGRG